MKTATVAAPGGTVDLTLANNTASDTDTIEVPADLSITTTDGLSIVNRGGAVRYTTVVTNAGSSAVTGAVVNDNFPGASQGLSGTINWTCTTTAGATCGGGATGSGTINRTVNMPIGSTITFTTTSGSVSTSTVLASISNTATVTVPGGHAEQTPANNTATDTTTIQGYHLAASSATSVNTTASQWSASVMVTVHDANHSPAQNVVINGAWAFGGSGGTSCTANASGQCTLTRTGISRLVPGIMLIVSGMSSGTNGYQVGQNEVSAIVVVGRP